MLQEISGGMREAVKEGRNESEYGGERKYKSTKWGEGAGKTNTRKKSSE